MTATVYSASALAAFTLFLVAALLTVGL